MCKKCRRKSFHPFDIRYCYLACCDKFSNQNEPEFEILMDIIHALPLRYLHKTFDWKKSQNLTETQKMILAIWKITKDSKLADRILMKNNEKKAYS